MTASSPAAAQVDPREHEVRLLVDMVRLSRSTLLIAEPGADKSALIQSQVMPLLAAAKTGGKTEIAILLDAWDQPPLPALQARIEATLSGLGATAPETRPDPASLPATLRAWQDALGATFIFVF